MYHGSESISGFVPGDNSRQTSSVQLLRKIISSENIKTILDLGCGEGNTVDYFKARIPDIRWVGIDIESSQEVERRKRTDAEFYSYDGVNIPFDDNYFDLIYCHQVFEHVHYPYELMKEIGRVLKRNGVFIGSTSQLEAFHSMSTFNYTPYGFSLLLTDTQLVFEELRPGIDVLTLIFVRILNGSRFFSKIIGRFFQKESPVNFLIGFSGKIMCKTKKEINLIKLLFCGQFSFIIRKNDY